VSTWEKGNRLNPDLLQQISVLCDKGLFEKHIMALVSIAPSTWYYWKKEALKLEKALAKGELVYESLPEDDQKILQFLEIVKKGRSVAIKENLDNITLAGKDPDHWQASAWFLERTDPEHFGRKERVELSGKDGKPIVIKVVYDEK